MAQNSYIPVRASSFPTSHPRTGAPFEPIGYVAGRAVWPMLGAAEGDDAAAQAAAQAAAATAAAAGATAGQGEDGSFPANTPVAEMTQAQQTAYWKHQSRRHESRVQAYGGRTPEQVAEAFEKAKRQDELEHELSSEADKRERAAREKAESEKDSHYRPMLAETAFRVAIGDRKTDAEVDDFLTELNLGAFLTDDGRVNTAKVLARAQQFAPAMGTQQQRKGPTVTGHGSGSSNSTRSGGGSVAEVMAERRAAREAKQ
jgi:hypothetical protein